MAEAEAEFSSIEEERDFYKNLALEYEKRLGETQLELEEFQESSRELEAELETQLEQTESRNKELCSLSNRLQLECEAVREKLEKTQHDCYHQISDLQDELKHVKSSRDDLQKYIRELEQLNDDLERAKRATLSSLEDFEARLNQAIERNAFLESELDEKEALAVMVQRLKDESRESGKNHFKSTKKNDQVQSHETNGKLHQTVLSDLRQEMAINQTKPLAAHPIDNDLRIDKTTSVVDSNKLKTELESQAGYPVKSLSSNQLNTSCVPLTPSSRISALNIVGDLLRKVGALESKLASCRTYKKDFSPKSEKEETSSQISAVKAKHLNKESPLGSSHDCISLTA